jgi:hypothetical protein
MQLDINPDIKGFLDGGDFTNNGPSFPQCVVHLEQDAEILEL